MATFLMILCLWPRYTIFIPWDWQLSWRFCFWTSDIFTLRQASFQMILPLEQDPQFLFVGYFSFCGYPINNRMIPNKAACFPLSKTAKITRNWHTQKFCNGKVHWWHEYRLLMPDFWKLEACHTWTGMLDLLLCCTSHQSLLMKCNLSWLVTSPKISTVHFETKFLKVLGFILILYMLDST